MYNLAKLADPEGNDDVVAVMPQFISHLLVNAATQGEVSADVIAKLTNSWRIVRRIQCETGHRTDHRSHEQGAD
jgi:hypothetical protein